MKIYIAGRVRNQRNYFNLFAVAADKLRAQGFTVYNPAAMNMEGTPLSKIMAHHLPQLCDCDAIALLPNWWRSPGARIEFLLARYCGKKVIWL